MKCLSMSQPWASLLTAGITRFEFRRWSTAYRGLVAIHAARRFPMANRVLCRTPGFRQVLRRAGFDFPADLPTQAILGTARLEACALPTAFDLASLDGEADRFRFTHLRAGWWVW